ncbi:MAG: glycoside hydrolase family 97 catalytic domain-containing protein [Verrucomicrobia bacterium]|nr:glycoside hydrolase family 97 catalytic domain-containing protein [Verrucomicrobiota bacterium]
MFHKNKFDSLLRVYLVCHAFLLVPARADEWSLTSPGGHCQISLTLSDGCLSYQTSMDGKTVLQRSPLGLIGADQDFHAGLRFEKQGRVEHRREKYELFAGKTPRVDDRLNYRRLAFRNAEGSPLVVELAASDQGVAFRYLFPETNATTRIIQSELTGFAVPANAGGWMQPYHAAGPYTPAYEDFYFKTAPGNLPPDSRQRAVGWAFPALWQIPDASAWVLLTESGTDGAYCACHLAPDATNGLYRVAFPIADEKTGEITNQFSPEPRSSLPWTMPWRVVIMAKSPTEIATGTLVTDLAAPSRIADTSWIKPGRASWAWWSYPDGPATAELFDGFSDLAAEMGWEYTLFDAGWWGPGLKPLADYAKRKGIRPMAWLHASDFYDPKKREAKLDEMTAAGIEGVKVDFWCSDRQEAVAAQQGLMQAAAARHIVVNLHGCTIPRGWERTWPNFISCEAVLGSESYFYEPRYTEKAAELDAVLPFTRNAVGPMDLTPIACSPKRFDRLTTAAHQLAAALIFTSGINHYADSPEFFHSLPPAVLQVFKDAPARWDETHCLAGEPGRLVVFARRAGDSWFIAGINGTTNAVPADLDLSPYGKYRQCIVITEGVDPKMQVSVAQLQKTSRWQEAIPPRGGFILRLTR